MTLGPAPDSFSARAMRIRQRIYERHVAQRQWEPLFESILSLLASSCDEYLTLREIHRHVPPDQIDPELTATMRETHRFARQYLQEFLVIPERRLHLVPLDDHGDDAEIVALAAGGFDE